MKSKSFLIITILTLALLSAACAAQEATNVPGDATAVPTTATDELATTEATGEAALTPTGEADSATPAEGTAEITVVPTTAADATAMIPGTGGDIGAGAPDDIDEVLRVLRESNVTVDLGDTVQAEFGAMTGQSILINGEEVQIFTFDSMEALEIQASQLAGAGGPEAEPQYYKLGPMLVHYAGTDPEVRDLLEDVLGAQAAGQ